MDEMAARIDKHYAFSRQEIFRLSMTSLVAGFGLTIYPGWGWFNLIEEASLINYAVNLFVAFIFIFISLILHFTAQKIVALKLGYTAEYAYWLNGFIISTVLCFMTLGFIPIFFTGSVDLRVEKKLRMGRFRTGIMHKDLGIVSFAGPLTSMLVAAVASPLYILTGSKLIFAFIAANALICILSMIPLPRFEHMRTVEGGTTGLYLLISSRWLFVLLAVTVFVYSVLILLAQVFSVILATAIGIITAFFYYKTYELK